MREAGAQPRRGLVVLVLGVLLMTPYLTLAESSGSDASGRSGKDMYVVDTRFDSPGSVFVDGIVHLSTATHTFQVKVGNAGVSGASDVSVQHRTTSAAEWVNVGSTASTGTLAPGATTAWMSFSLGASAVGPNQEVRVLISTEGDANPSNNNRTTVFDVEDITSGYITSNDLPPPADGSSRIRLTTTSNFPVITNVVNNGTQDAQVNIRIELHDSGGIVGSPWQSGLTTVNANRVSTPFQSVAITTTLNLSRDRPRRGLHPANHGRIHGVEPNQFRQCPQGGFRDGLPRRCDALHTWDSKRRSGIPCAPLIHPSEPGFEWDASLHLGTIEPHRMGHGPTLACHRNAGGRRSANRHCSCDGPLQRTENRFRDRDAVRELIRWEGLGTHIHRHPVRW